MEAPYSLKANSKLLLHQHKRINSSSLQDVNVKGTTSLAEGAGKSNNKLAGLKSCPLIHNVIYINPSKIASKCKAHWNSNPSISLKEQRALPIGSSNNQVKRSKVFINPNFNKPALHNQNVQYPAASSSATYVNNQHKISSNSGLKLNKLLKTAPDPRQKPDSLNSTINTKIYINPKFNPPKSTLVCSAIKSYSVLDEQIGGVPSNGICLNSFKERTVLRYHNMSQPTSTKNMSTNQIDPSKRKHEKIGETIEESLDHNKRAKLQLSNPKTTAGKIFLNPSFKQKVATTQLQTVQKDRNYYEKIANSFHLGTSTDTAKLINAGMLTHHKSDCEFGANDVRRKSSTLGLVSLSPTKLVRKRKLSQGSSKKKSFKRTSLIFLSKTKLVRSVTTSSVKDIISVNKTMIRRAVPKTQLHLLNADQVKRLRRQNFSNSLTKLVDIMPSSNEVTKVKSKNGRSLQLIRKSLDSSVILRLRSGNGKSLKLIRKTEDMPAVTKIKSKNGKSLQLIRKNTEMREKFNEKRHVKNLALRQKHFHLQQASKRAQYFLQSKWRQSQFSKINVPSTRNPITNKNKYKFERNRSLSKNTLSKEKMESRQLLHPNNLEHKLITSNAKSVVSKYKLVRKSSVHNKSKGLKKELTEFTRKNPITNKNKYKFERNRSLSKNTLSKEKTECRQLLHPNNLEHKLITSNAKSVVSKYKLVCKSSVHNKSKGLKKEVTEFTRKATPSTSSKKWKRRKKLPENPLQRKQMSIVNIGGVFYRCTRTSLSKNKTSPVKDHDTKGPLLNIRGQKFQFDDNGHTLKCLDNKLVRKRIDIGGVTFISSSSGNSLTRTNYHTARSILTQAKQKSLAQLINKRRKNNEPCPFYHRFGRCSGKDRGTCIRQHDQKYVAVCKKFVSGNCKDSKCLLSHVTSVHNMPTCQHYLAGQCGRDNCPYPHVKLSDSAPLCIDFLRGFCNQGEQCTKRHLELCPSFEKGACPRGKYCPYPHPKSNNKFKKVVKNVRKKPRSAALEQKAVITNLRYFQDANLQEEKKIQLTEESEDLASVEEISDGEEVVRRFKNRPKLGRLPSYIPLNRDSSCSESDKD